MKRLSILTALLAAILLSVSCRKEGTKALLPVITINPYGAIDTVLHDSVPYRFGTKCYALITVNGQIVYTKSYGGLLDSTVAKVASCSKWLSGAALMSLVDQGKLALDDSIGTYLPVFSQYGKGNITIAQLFSHT